MARHIQNPYKKYLTVHVAFLALALLLAAFDSIDLLKKLAKTQYERQRHPFYFSGLKFSGLEDTLKNVDYIGYYTDKDLNLKENAAQFSQAQYILAPTILDLNNTSHTFILFDCTNEKKAMSKIKQVHAIAIKKNRFGIILARKIQ